jgi:hypothetical protein
LLGDGPVDGEAALEAALSCAPAAFVPAKSRPLSMSACKTDAVSR